MLRVWSGFSSFEDITRITYALAFTNFELSENMQISFSFCKTCICLKILENIQIPVNMIDRLDITDEYSVKCDFILNTIIFIDAALIFH